MSLVNVSGPSRAVRRGGRVEPPVLQVVLAGNPVSGFSLHGPFRTAHAATDWASRNVESEWWVVDMEKPGDL